MFRLGRIRDRRYCDGVARKPKTFTREQLESRKDKAVRFTRDVLGDAERASEIEDESLDDYAARRHMQLSNPERRHIVPRKTVDDYRAEIAELKDEVKELEDENEDLQEQLDQISEIVAPEVEDETDEVDEEDADTGDGDDEPD